MEESKFKVGDKVRIINFGHPIYTSKKGWEDMCSFTEGKLKPDNILTEDDKGYYHDINPSIIGKEAEIIGISQDLKSYRTNIFSWATDGQLELI